MAPKGNSKAEAGRARKAEAAAAKDAQAARAAEEKEAEKWTKGAKGKSSAEAKAEKAAETAAKKAEAKKQLEAEEASLPSKGEAQKKGGAKGKAPAKTESYSASGLDNALEMMSLVGEKTDKASVGNRAATKVDSHPERRFKAAFEAFKEREMEQVKKDFPRLRLVQYNDLLYKKFQKSPENPFNQVTVAYDASKEEKVGALEAIKESKLSRYV